MKNLNLIFDDLASKRSFYKLSLQKTLDNNTFESPNKQTNISISNAGNTQSQSNNNNDPSQGSKLPMESIHIPFDDGTKTPIVGKILKTPDLNTCFKERRFVARAAIKFNLDNDLYHILEIDPQCDKREIIGAYRKLSMKFHPDKCTIDDGYFCKINEAYTILANEETRQIYDEFGYEYVKSFKSMMIPFQNP